MSSRNCARATSRSRWSRDCAWKSARGSPTSRAFTCTPRRARRSCRSDRSRRSPTNWRRPMCAGGTTSGRSPCPASRPRASCPRRSWRPRPRLLELQRSLPIGYKMEVGGEEEEQRKGFRNIAIAMAISVTLIFLALVIQFKNAVKPFIVFAAIPYGMVGAFAALYLTGTPFGFMAFLGIASLVGVIVSHVIVLFDFIEEKHAEGEPPREALLDAGIIRLRPVLITVGATVFGLFPLAAHGGPLWEPLCYTQIGGLTLATFVTLLMVPVLYAICVLDLKVVRWESQGPS